LYVTTNNYFSNAMKKLLLLALAAAAALSIVCCKEKQEPDPEAPMFWTWLDYREGMNFDSICELMDSAGLDGIMLNAPTPDDYRRLIPIAQRHGITVYAWLWTLNLEHDRDDVVAAHSEWLSVNRLGHSLADSIAYVKHYKFLCPALPEVREYLKERVRSFAEVEGLEGIAIDFNRFVDVILPTSRWQRFDVVQDHEYACYDYGYHPAMIEKFKALHGYDPREQADPSQDPLWRQFRCNQITEVANELAEVVHDCGKVMAASPFPTSKVGARMVRQDWKSWNLDIVFPMVYHNFYTNDPSFIADCTLENERDLRNRPTTLYCGMMAFDTTALFQCMDSAFANGARGIALFTMQGLRTPALRSRFRAYADSMRAVRADGRLAPLPGRAAAANPDPFSHPGVMSKVERAMQRLLLDENASEDTPLPQVAPGPYRLTDSCDVSMRYIVTDSLSGRDFTVSFYTYGDILFGWRIHSSDKPDRIEYR